MMQDKASAAVAMLAVVFDRAGWKAAHVAKEGAPGDVVEIGGNEITLLQKSVEWDGEEETLSTAISALAQEVMTSRPWSLVFFDLPLSGGDTKASFAGVSLQVTNSQPPYSINVLFG